MTTKKKPTKYTSDQIKHNHREAFKGHKTRRHFINEVHEEEAKEEIKDTRLPPDRYGD